MESKEDLNKLVETVNKSRSIREILDFNNDGEVDDAEAVLGVESGIINRNGDLITPMSQFFLRYGNVGMGLGYVKPRKIKKKKHIKKEKGKVYKSIYDPIINKDIEKAIGSQVSMVEQSVAAFREDVGRFDTRFY